MTTQTWTEQLDFNFTATDLSTFNDMFDLRATSSQIEQLVLTQDDIDFEDSQQNGPVEDIHLYHKALNPHSKTTIANHMVSLLNVSDHEEICIYLFSLAKKNHFNVEKMMDRIKKHPEELCCNEVLFDN